MFPWSDTCLFHRLRKQRRLSEKETEILDTWNAGKTVNSASSLFITRSNVFIACVSLCSCPAPY